MGMKLSPFQLGWSFFPVLSRPYTGFGWDGAGFLRSSSHGAVWQIWDQGRAGDTPLFELLLSSACTASGASLFLTLPPNELAAVGRRLWGTLSQDREVIVPVL